MKTKKNAISTLVLIAFAFLFIASGNEKSIVTPIAIPVFDYSPPSKAEPGSNNPKIALFEPEYVGNGVLISNRSPFTDFRQSMSADFQELISSKGFALKGPFDSYDFMTYSDKQECDLGVFVELDLSLIQTSGGWKYTPPSGYFGDYSTYQGGISLSGKINIYVTETFTRQKLIIKSLPVPQTNLSVRAEQKYKGRHNSTIPMGDAGVCNPVTLAMQEFYNGIMQRAWDLLSPEELNHAKSQVEQIRKESGYIKK